MQLFAIEYVVLELDGTFLIAHIHINLLCLAPAATPGVDCQVVKVALSGVAMVICDEKNKLLHSILFIYIGYAPRET